MSSELGSYALDPRVGQGGVGSAYPNANDILTKMWTKCDLFLSTVARTLNLLVVVKWMVGLKPCSQEIILNYFELKC